MRQQRSSAAPSPLNIPGSNQTSCFTSGRSSRVGTPRSNSIYGSDTGSGTILDNKTSSILESPDDGYEQFNSTNIERGYYLILCLVVSISPILIVAYILQMEMTNIC